MTDHPADPAADHLGRPAALAATVPAAPAPVQPALAAVPLGEPPDPPSAQQVPAWAAAAARPLVVAGLLAGCLPAAVAADLLLVHRAEWQALPGRSVQVWFWIAALAAAVVTGFAVACAARPRAVRVSRTTAAALAVAWAAGLANVTLSIGTTVYVPGDVGQPIGAWAVAQHALVHTAHFLTGTGFLLMAVTACRLPQFGSGRGPAADHDVRDRAAELLGWACAVVGGCVAAQMLLAVVTRSGGSANPLDAPTSLYEAVDRLVWVGLAAAAAVILAAAIRRVRAGAWPIGLVRLFAWMWVAAAAVTLGSRSLFNAAIHAANPGDPQPFVWTVFNVGGSVVEAVVSAACAAAVLRVVARPAAVAPAGSTARAFAPLMPAVEPGPSHGPP